MGVLLANRDSVASRLAIGLSIDTPGNEIRAALHRVFGFGLSCRAETLGAVATPVHRTTGHAQKAVASANDVSCFVQATEAGGLARQLCDATQTVAERAAIQLDQILFLSVLPAASSPAAIELAVVAPALADLTGITTLAGYSTNDRAAGGRGRSLGTLVDWVLASDPRSSRLVFHLDGVTSLTHLTAGADPSRVRMFETGPGTIFLDDLAATLSNGRQPADSRGMLAVQGRQIKPLVRRWASHAFLRLEPPKFLDPADFAGPFIEETIQMTVDRGWSAADVLCTATHFVAACAADAVRQFVNLDSTTPQAVLVGKGTQNGFLLRLLEEQLAGMGIMAISMAKIAPESYDATTAAVLGCLTLDGVPIILPHAIGAAGPRLAGQLSPGTPQNWRQCIEWMHRVVPSTTARAA